MSFDPRATILEWPAPSLHGGNGAPPIPPPGSVWTGMVDGQAAARAVIAAGGKLETGCAPPPFHGSYVTIVTAEEHARNVERLARDGKFIPFGNTGACAPPPPLFSWSPARRA